MTYRFIVTPKDQLLAACDALSEALDAYGGEPVIAHEHPLHAAAVGLEGLTRQSDRKDSKQKAKLCSPMDAVWFRLLWASRDHQPNWNPELWPDESQLTPRVGSPPTQSGPAKPDFAMGWRDILKTYLAGFRELVSNDTYYRVLAEAGTGWEARRGLAEMLNDPTIVASGENGA
jgi:hypothetical protein